MKFKRVILPTTITVPDNDYCFCPEGQCPHFMGYGNGIYCNEMLTPQLIWENNLVIKPTKCKNLELYCKGETE
jgi:hypothetical protein